MRIILVDQAETLRQFGASPRPRRFDHAVNARVRCGKAGNYFHRIPLPMVETVSLNPSYCTAGAVARLTAIVYRNPDAVSGKLGVLHEINPAL